MFIDEQAHSLIGFVYQTHSLLQTMIGEMCITAL
jgi:hypothetical protein